MTRIFALLLISLAATLTQAALTRIPGIKNQHRAWEEGWRNSGSHQSQIQTTFVANDLPGCDQYHFNQCQGNNIITPPEFEARRWYTPLKGDADYQSSFQDYGLLTGYVRVQYASTARTSATITIYALHKDNSTQLTYILDGEKQTSNIANYDQTYTKILQIQIAGSDGSLISLEPVDFWWNTAGAHPIKHTSGDYRNGQKGAIVEMFGWPHADIAKECQAMSQAGYLGVKVFPPQEQIMSGQPFNNILNPWYFMYQPVSYRLSGRMGTRDELRDMIATCRSMNVRVYADAVINHMVGGGNDANPYHRSGGQAPHCNTFPQKNSSLPGGSSPMYTQSFTYTTSPHTGLSALQEFPAVGYGPQDFHCERALNSWTDPLDLNAGWLTGLVDLNTELDNVQERIAAYLTDLISIGFSGFRIDAAKHIKPDDLVAILSKFQRNMGGALPDDFVTWLEILLGGEADLLMCNENSGYNYGGYLYKSLLSAGISSTDADKVKIWNSGYPKEPEKGTCTISKKRSAIQNDDADQQNQGSSSRDMGNTGCVLVTGGCSSTSEHRSFEQELFTNPPGADSNNDDYPIRMVLSSYWFPNLSALGIPDGKSDCSQCTLTCDGCHGVPYVQAYKADSTGYDGAMGKVDYTRVHRDSAIITAMRKWMGLSALESNQSTPIMSAY